MYTACCTGECGHIIASKAKQREKILDLFDNRAAQARPMVFLVWVTVVSHIMKLHFRLFKAGTWHSHKRQGVERIGCFPFCRRPCDNPAAKLLSAIGAMLLDPMGTGKAEMPLLFGRYGDDFANWPSALLHTLHVSLVLVFCRGWRMLFFAFQRYPWLLAPAFDPESSAAERDDALNKFLALPRGSSKLDPGLGRKLRDMVTSVDDLLQPQMYEFLQTLFLRIVITSTFVERLFKALTCWTNRHAQGAASIAAKHVNAVFSAEVERWRATVSAHALEPSGTKANQISKLGANGMHVCEI